MISAGSFVQFLKIWGSAEITSSDLHITKIVRNHDPDYTVVFYGTLDSLLSAVFRIERDILKIVDSGLLKEGDTIEKVLAVTAPENNLLVDVYAVFTIKNNESEGFVLEKTSQQRFTKDDPDGGPVPIEVLGFTLEELNLEVA